MTGPAGATTREAPWPEGWVLAAVSLGGVVGSLGRYAVGLGLPNPSGSWPWSTLLVNLTGCVAMGLLVSYLVDRPGTHPLARPFLGVGVLGGWTTYSTFAVDVVELAQAGRAGPAAAYVVVSVVLGVLGVGLGTAVGQRVWPGP